ncbi:protein of unknown function [Xylanibacter ruminicola]|jgi:hypothetical protein|uniref:Uncharacterized protein n=1 Tax=Xylanibacter ruminicola TaxID=839 RepID=A0A1H5RMW1_XYLRU|nr:MULTISPECIES: DUF4834 family protein [Prevotellaceae]MCR5471092.1 DUF4834 family protein [Prevotella sp.]SEF39580.1 protein of unknown function [Xylanibacter ruminicola]SEW09768.1 protein of unknown function [Prevotella sp. khp7]
MKIFFAIVIFGLIGITIIVMIVINFMYHNIKKLREEVEDRYYRNLKRKEQKEKNPFGDDYFKSSNKKQSARAQRQYAQREQKANSNTTTRRTTTSDGVTIIDDRNEEKKIFNQGDGEYVEFEEV